MFIFDLCLQISRDIKHHCYSDILYITSYKGGGVTKYIFYIRFLLDRQKQILAVILKLNYTILS